MVDFEREQGRPARVAEAQKELKLLRRAKAKAEKRKGAKAPGPPFQGLSWPDQPHDGPMKGIINFGVLLLDTFTRFEAT